MDTNSNMETQDKQPKLIDVNVENENVALNLLVGFVNLAQQRGVYNIQESAKIWECIKTFQKQSN
tara:strand:- start:446 stop:640 length:195 start_codon:yes stop_codon:yes gene_type:complete